MSGTRPQRLGAGIYRWHLRDGRFDTVTMRTEQGEIHLLLGTGEVSLAAVRRTAAASTSQGKQ